MEPEHLADAAGPVVRRGPVRDRRGRGMRGPAVLSPAWPATGPRPPRPRSRREVFDRIMLDVVTDIDARWSEHLGLVEYAVEDSPQVPDDWDSGRVPLSALVPGTGPRPTRLVVFRRPLEHRATTRAELEAMILTIVVEQVADLLGLDPADVDPRYRGDED